MLCVAHLVVILLSTAMRERPPTGEGRDAAPKEQILPGKLSGKGTASSGNSGEGRNTSTEGASVRIGFAWKPLNVKTLRSTTERGGHLKH